ncbi:AAA family ATPase [Candidatus Bathyarchaeota archaeon]|nr:AAA family ATPase [Candidatus Bathyarchaeota archaeon]
MLQKIPTGCRGIDKFLGGGLSFDSVSLIYGEAETGKTTLAMQCAINCVRQGYKTLFIDCDGTFSTRRLSQMVPEQFKELAELIILMKPNNFREQTVVIDQLTNYITKNFGLIVFDTITTLYRVEVAEYPEKTFTLNRELNRQIALLAQIAKTEKIAVLMTSQVRSFLNYTYVSVEPVATRVLKFWADTIIAMKPTENSHVIQVILEKSPIRASATEAPSWHLKIDSTGIYDY